MTKGFKSTEFWATVAAVAAGAYMAQNGVALDTIVGVLSPVLVYTGGRSFVKARNGGG